MGRIFLSYAREDRPFAERLARVLEKNGHEVWWDRRLDGGEEYSTEIETALDNADVVLVAWSASSIYPARVAATAAAEEQAWLDEPESTPLNFITSRAAAPLRRDPRYLALAQRVGLLAYWRNGKLPDFCGSQPEPVCAQLKRR